MRNVFPRLRRDFPSLSRRILSLGKRFLTLRKPFPTLGNDFANLSRDKTTLGNHPISLAGVLKTICLGSWACWFGTAMLDWRPRVAGKVCPGTACVPPCRRAAARWVKNARTSAAPKSRGCRQSPDCAFPNRRKRCATFATGVGDCQALNSLHPPAGGVDADYGSKGKPSSLRNSLCLLVASLIFPSIFTSSPCVAVKSISASATAVLM